MGSKGKMFYKTLMLYKKGLLQNRCICLYNKRNQTILRKYKIDAIQAPVNILDNRFLDKKLLDNLKKEKFCYS